MAAPMELGACAAEVEEIVEGFLWRHVVGHGSSFNRELAGTYNTMHCKFSEHGHMLCDVHVNGVHALDITGVMETTLGVRPLAHTKKDAGKLFPEGGNEVWHGPR